MWFLAPNDSNKPNPQTHRLCSRELAAANRVSPFKRANRAARSIVAKLYRQPDLAQLLPLWETEKINSQIEPPTSDWLQVPPRPLRRETQCIVGPCRHSQRFHTPKARTRKFLRLDPSMFNFPSQQILCLPAFRFCAPKMISVVLGLGLYMKNSCFHGWK